MIANDDLAYITNTSNSWCSKCSNCFYYAPQNKFTFTFLVSKYVTRYTFGKLYDWPIQIHVNERVGYMQRMSIIVTNTSLQIHVNFCFILYYFSNWT